MNIKTILPAERLSGDTLLPGDKSISHRLAIIGAISEGTTVVENFSDGADCATTLACLMDLGVVIERSEGRVTIEGQGLRGLCRPDGALDAGNSGTTVRLLSGVLAAYSFESVIVGDSSLSRRPMERIAEPLRLFGARVDAEGGSLPLRIQGGGLRAIRYVSPVPSAQVKSAVLLAGLHAAGTTSFEERVPTRNHTEIALAAAGARIRNLGRTVEVEGGVPLKSRRLRIPGDLSSAAFLVAAALALPGSELRLRQVGVNPTRSAYLDLFERLGANLKREAAREADGEAVSDLIVRHSRLSQIDVSAADVPGLIDEIPVLAVLGACTGVGVRIRGAGELRRKESDRIAALASNLVSIGFEVEEFADGLEVPGDGRAAGGTVRSSGDHRIAMAFAVAGLLSESGVRIEDPDCVGISFPGFFDLLERLAGT